MIIFTHRRWQGEAQDLALSLYRRNKQVVTVVAPPGAGKTKQAANLCLVSVRAGLADKFFFVAPTLKIKQQWIDVLNSFELRAAAIENWPSERFNAFVLLYQNIGKYARRLAQTINTRDMVVFDECHHMGDRKAWGTGAYQAFQHAGKIYNLSGTLWREDNFSIPFVQYDANGLAKSDYYYSHGEAVADGVCRPIDFIAHDAKGASGKFLSNMLAEKVAKAHNKALHVETEFIAQMVGSFIEAILNTRAKYPATAGLIICKDIINANLIGELIERTHGFVSPVVHSDDEDSLERLERFSGTREPFLISVNMVSEGVDIPRLVGELFLTRVKTERYFHQAAGRIVRVSDGMPERAFMHIPAIETYLRYARNLGSVKLHQLREIRSNGFEERKKKKSYDRRPAKKSEEFRHAGAFNVDEHLQGLDDLRELKRAVNKETFRVAARCQIDVKKLHTAWFKLLGKYSEQMNQREFEAKLKWASELFQLSRGQGGRKVVQEMVVEILKVRSAI